MLRQICVETCPSTTWTFFPDIAKLAAAELSTVNPSDREAVANAASSTFNLDWNAYICTYGFTARNAYVNMGMVS